MSKLKILLIFVFIFLFSSLYSKDIELRTSVNAYKLGIDDYLIYTVKVLNVNNPPVPEMRKIKGFKVVQSSQSTRFFYSNGKSVLSTDFVFYLQAQKVGHYKINPIEYNYNGKRLVGKAYNIEVVAGAILPSQQSGRSQSVGSFGGGFDDDFFKTPFDREERRNIPIDVKLRGKLSKKKVYKGEQLLYTVELLSLNTANSISADNDPPFDGFWKELVHIPHGNIRGRNERVGDKNYTVFEIKKIILFPNKTGTLTLPTLKFSINIGSGSFFGRSRVLRRSLKGSKVEVIDLPKEYSSLPVGDFNLNVDIKNKDIDVNDMLSVVVRLEGEGNLKTLTLPLYKNNDNFKVYEGKKSSDHKVYGDILKGRLREEQAISFYKSGDFVLEPLTFTFFNPKEAKVKTIKTKPIKVHVSGVKDNAKTVNKGGVVTQLEVNKRGEDIAYIREGKLKRKSSLLFQSPIFYPFVYLPFLITILVLIIYPLRNKIFSVKDSSKKEFRETLKLLNSSDDSQLYPILESYIGKRLKINPSSFSLSKIEEELQKRRINHQLLKATVDYLREAESLRYSGVGSKGKGDLRLKLSSLLRQLEGKLK